MGHFLVFHRFQVWLGAHFSVCMFFLRNTFCSLIICLAAVVEASLGIADGVHVRGIGMNEENAIDGTRKSDGGAEIRIVQNGVKKVLRRFLNARGKGFFFFVFLDQVSKYIFVCLSEH